jgi:hypothetical protein
MSGDDHDAEDLLQKFRLEKIREAFIEFVLSDFHSNGIEKFIATGGCGLDVVLGGWQAFFFDDCEIFNGLHNRFWGGLGEGVDIRAST